MKFTEICDNKCTGCGACKVICPKNAITIEYNERGFLYPVVDEDTCVDCGLCKKTCNKELQLNQLLSSYVLKIRDYDKYKKSQSGGAFTLFSDYVLSQNGIVYGACINDQNELSHIRVTSFDKRDSMHGSVYIQSKAYEVYERVYFDLDKNEQLILFVGTPCQVAGLKKYLITKKANTDKLITIDLLCHGVPTIFIWREIIKYHERKNRTRYTSIQLCGIDEDSRPYIAFVDANSACPDTKFKKLYHSNLALRESCYQCRYTSINRVGDISIGDAPKAKQNYPEIYDSKGISFILINSIKGTELFQCVKDNAIWLNAPIGDNMQQCLFESARGKRAPKEFWHDYESRSFEYIVKKYADHNVFLNIPYIMKRVLRLFEVKK